MINQDTDYGHTVSFLFNMSQIFRVIGQIDRVILRGNWGIFSSIYRLIFKEIPTSWVWDVNFGRKEFGI